MTYFPPGITRVNGTANPGSFYGYQTRFFQVAGSGFTAGFGAPLSVYETATFAIETVAAITILGTPTTAGFIVAVDGDSFYGEGDNTGYGGDTSTATLAYVIYNASGVTCTVTEVVLSGVGFTTGTVANWSNIV